jgi:hypothetical protein
MTTSHFRLVRIVQNLPMMRKLCRSRIIFADPEP